jgi:hypothetical protein
MRRLLSTLVLAAGCASPDEFRDDPSALPTADRRELDLRKNLRDGRAWEEQERLMADVKAAFGGPSDADALGPKTGSPARSGGAR